MPTPGGDDSLAASLVDRLRHNTTDGASALARQAIGGIAAFVGDADPGPGLPDRVRALCDRLARARPSMAAVGAVVERWAATFSWPRRSAAFRAEALDHVRRALEAMDRAREETVARAVERLPAGASILTHSASGTVREVLARLRTRRVTVTASEPGGEGRRLAAAIGARCIDDRTVADHMKEIDLVLVGADAVLATGDFVNKVGTHAVARAARGRDVPFHVVFESFKRLPARAIVLDEPSFELVPAALVTSYLTDAPAAPELDPWG